MKAIKICIIGCIYFIIVFVIIIFTVDKLIIFANNCQAYEMLKNVFQKCLSQFPGTRTSQNSPVPKHFLYSHK